MLLIVACVLVCATMLVAAIATWSNTRESQEKTVKRVSVIADALNRTAADALARGDLDGVRQSILGIADSPVLNYVQICHKATRTIIDPHSLSLEHKARARTPILDQAARTGETIMQEFASSVVVARPVIKDGEQVGAVVVSLKRATFAHLFWPTFGQLASAVLAICVLALGLAHIFIQRALRPVTALTNAAIGVSQGLFHVNLPTAKDDEIGKLSDAFARMVKTIRGNYERIHELAYRDMVTRLPNRALFKRETESAIVQAHDLCGYVLFIDLDRFKWVNDSFGHDYGDQLLKAIGTELQRLAEEFSFDMRVEKDMAGASEVELTEPLTARFGGDEFAILVRPGYTRDEIEYYADALLQVFESPIDVNGQPVRIGASIGIAVFSEADTLDVVLKQADMAMYDIKHRGGHDYCFFSAELDQQLNARLELERDLRVALEREEFELYYQPKVDCRTGRPVGLEALIRWNHPERGMVSPLEFIPLAEEIGIIVTLGAWVLQEACCQTAEWNEQGHDITIAVNLSAIQFENPKLIDEVNLALEVSGLDPEKLELEITESMMMADPVRAADIITPLRDRGIRFAIDDFGTGYSSLSYLTSLPMDAVKIDRSFINNMARDENSRVVVETILAMARSLNFETVAEGVETEEHAAFLARQGCSLAQGYLFSKPVPAKDCDDWLKSNSVADIKYLNEKLAEALA
ncbi:putative bifunctional diguanylate cyclase/phosphodiesterase [Coralliovum pocilloporae]|uniref:putative bifunctional diguanylate cyclase/phosphodiesterase n=1 Tax=Coralliovum pocilloporae TaxID=3066369 RepID=UPI00330714F4